MGWTVMLEVVAWLSGELMLGNHPHHYCSQNITMRRKIQVTSLY